MTDIKDKVEMIQVDKIIKYTHNPKSHPSDQIDKIASSIKNYGFDQPIVVDGENEIIKGHGRLEAAKKLGLDKVPVIKQEDLSEAQVRGARLADNKTAESEWLDEELALEFDELEGMDFDLELTGFEDSEISEVLDGQEVESPEPEGIDKDIEDIKILNLYAGIGGNRKFWGDLDVTAIEYNEEIAKAYQDFFPNDEIIIDDAHEYLEKHFDEYDFIWTSPPCPTHSRLKPAGVAATKKGNTGCFDHEQKAIYPDMNLYQEIIFLDTYFEGKYAVENVISYYDPLIEPQKIDRHYFWTNFDISDILEEYLQRDAISDVEHSDPKHHAEQFGYTFKEIPDPSDYPRIKIVNNLINPKLGEHILKSAYSKEVELVS